MKRKLLIAIVLTVLAVIGLLVWGITWAFTATPAGSAGLDREMAAIATWPDVDPEASAAARRAWETALDRFDDLVAESETGFPADVQGLGRTLADLEAPDDDPELGMLHFGRRDDDSAGFRADLEAMLTGRAEDLLASDVLARFAAIAEGPRPALDASQLATLGFGTSSPFNVLMPNMNRSRQAARSLAIAVSRAAADGDDHHAVDLLRAGEGLARGSEAMPNLISQLVAAAIRAMAIEYVVDIATAGDLGPEALADCRAWLESLDADVGATERFDRALAGELASSKGMLGHLYDENGRALTAEWAAVGAGGVAASPLTNLMGLALPRRAAIESRLDDLYAGRVTSEELRDGGPIGPDFLVGILAPAIERFRAQGDDTASFRALAILALAIVEYELVHGEAPADLDAVDIPAERLIDPSNGERLRYRRLDPSADSGTSAGSDDPNADPTPRWEVWSIGSDGKDDGGSRNGDLVLSAPPR